MGSVDFKQKIKLINRIRERKGINKEDRRAAYEALRQLEKEKIHRVREYELHMVLPSTDSGHLYTEKVDKFLAGDASEAVRYASEKYGIPSFDPLDFYEQDSRQYYDADDCGIMKVRAVTDGDKIFTEGDMLRCVELIFKNHTRDIIDNRGSMVDYNNSPEVLKLVIKKFGLPINNKLTEIYKEKKRNE